MTISTYDPFALHVLGYAYGFTSWAYLSRDSLEAICAPGYFDAAYEMLRDGDRLAVNVRDASGLTLAAQDFVVCRRNGRVALAPLTPAVAPGHALRARLGVEAA